MKLASATTTWNALAVAAMMAMATAPASVVAQTQQTSVDVGGGIVALNCWVALNNPACAMYADILPLDGSAGEVVPNEQLVGGICGE